MSMRTMQFDPGYYPEHPEQTKIKKLIHRIVPAGVEPGTSTHPACTVQTVNPLRSSNVKALRSFQFTQLNVLVEVIYKSTMLSVIYKRM